MDTNFGQIFVRKNWTRGFCIVLGPLTIAMYVTLIVLYGTKIWDVICAIGNNLMDLPLIYIIGLGALVAIYVVRFVVWIFQQNSKWKKFLFLINCLAFFPFAFVLWVGTIPLRLLGWLVHYFKGNQTRYVYRSKWLGWILKSFYMDVVPFRQVYNCIFIPPRNRMKNFVLRTNLFDICIIYTILIALLVCLVAGFYSFEQSGRDFTPEHNKGGILWNIKLVLVQMITDPIENQQLRQGGSMKLYDGDGGFVKTLAELTQSSNATSGEATSPSDDEIGFTLKKEDIEHCPLYDTNGCLVYDKNGQRIQDYGTHLKFQVIHWFIFMLFTSCFMAIITKQVIDHKPNLVFPPQIYYDPNRKQFSIFCWNRDKAFLTQFKTWLEFEFLLRGGDKTRQERIRFFGDPENNINSMEVAMPEPPVSISPMISMQIRTTEWTTKPSEGSSDMGSKIVPYTYGYLHKDGDLDKSVFEKDSPSDIIGTEHKRKFLQFYPTLRYGHYEKKKSRFLFDPKDKDADHVFRIMLEFWNDVTGERNYAQAEFPAGTVICGICREVPDCRDWTEMNLLDMQIVDEIGTSDYEGRLKEDQANAIRKSLPDAIELIIQDYGVATEWNVKTIRDVTVLISAFFKSPNSKTWEKCRTHITDKLEGNDPFEFILNVLVKFALNMRSYVGIKVTGKCYGCRFASEPCPLRPSWRNSRRKASKGSDKKIGSKESEKSGMSLDVVKSMQKTIHEEMGDLFLKTFFEKTEDGAGTIVVGISIAGDNEPKVSVIEDQKMYTGYAAVTVLEDKHKSVIDLENGTLNFGIRRILENAITKKILGNDCEKLADEKEKFAYIEMVMVEKKHRGKGYHRKMVEELEKIASQKKCRYIVTTVSPFNASSLAAFTKDSDNGLDYTIIGIIYVSQQNVWQLVLGKRLAKEEDKSEKSSPSNEPDSKEITAINESSSEDDDSEDDFTHFVENE